MYYFERISVEKRFPRIPVIFNAHLAPIVRSSGAVLFVWYEERGNVDAAVRVCVRGDECDDDDHY